MASTTDEQRLRDVFHDLAGETLADPVVGRPAAARALEHHTRRRTRRAITVAGVVVVTLVVATVAVIGRPAGDGIHTVASTRAPAPDRLIPRKLKVVDRLDGSWAIEPIAYDGTDVWLARQQVTASAVEVMVERRAANSGALLSSITVPQEAAYAIAVGDGSVWVSGGGDGGVYDTTVSRIDLATRRVAFTRTLPRRAACSCPIAVGAGAAWIGGGSAKSVIRLDESTGAVRAVIPLGQESASLAVVGDRVQVGLDNSRVAIVDPATNRVERTVTVSAPGGSAAGTILGIDPLGAGASRALRSDGVAFEIAGNQRVQGPPVVFLRPLNVGSSATLGPLVWATGLDQMLVSSADGRASGYANYDLTAQTFGRVEVRSRRFVPTVGEANGLFRVIAAGSTLWIATFNGPILVVAPS